MDEEALEEGGLLMTHLTEYQFKKYLENDLSERDQNIVESHLYICDSCFYDYLMMMDSYPSKGNLSEDFTNQVVSKIYGNHSIQKKLPRQTLAKKALMHYSLAAALTILLMLTGVFQGIVDLTNTKNIEDKPSITNQMMKETDRLLDQIKGEKNK